MERHMLTEPFIVGCVREMEIHERFTQHPSGEDATMILFLPEKPTRRQIGPSENTD